MSAKIAKMNLIAERMVADGWCIHQVRYLTRMLDVETVSYLSCLQRSTLRPESHNDCLAASNCVAYNIDENNYKTRHADPCNESDCEHVFVPYDELIRTIQEGHVPLVSVHSNNDVPPKLSIKIHKRESFSQYWALSHVWADGLGNPNIKKEHRHLREASIACMASIYAGAHTTMVLDAELMATTTTTHECLARIICSVWMRRSWTLQEGLLSPQCTIWFADKAVIFRPAEDGELMTWGYPYQAIGGTDAPKRHLNAIDDSIQTSLIRFLEYHFLHIRHLIRLKDQQFSYNAHDQVNYFGNETSQFPNFGGPASISEEKLHAALCECFVLIWNALSGRSTSKSKELSLILANLLDMGCGPLLNLTTEERLQSIIFSLPRLPLSLLFNSGPKLTSKKYPFNRWVPVEMSADLLTQRSTLQFLDPGDKSSKHFLKAKGGYDFKCIVVKGSELLKGRTFLLDVLDTNTNIICTTIPFEVLPPVLEGSTDTCILFEAHDSMRGALLQVSQTDLDTVYLVYHCAIRLEINRNVAQGLQTFQGSYLASNIELLILYSENIY
ncbi:hypothetical protein N0V90_001432 [Kalmusia sp. IMI 367209]|nr:hypothetical protein N0V90_001432 [Kalmusia sp. IMI 367209]